MPIPNRPGCYTGGSTVETTSTFVCRNPPAKDRRLVSGESTRAPSLKSTSPVLTGAARDPGRAIRIQAEEPS
ncbi:hypothetical protein GCM10010270_34410 [Streptomyces violaceus]|nr:hypothetical protein GCM10010270_34410 [Streptomyces janthinus]